MKWYSYSGTRVATGHGSNTIWTYAAKIYCPYDKENFIPSQPYPKEEMTIETLSRTRLEVKLGYDLLIDYRIAISGTGAISFTSITIADKARNPIDRSLRKLSSSSGPDYWVAQWWTTEDVLKIE